MNADKLWISILGALMCTPAALGQALYTETFGPTTMAAPISSVGWANDLIAQPNRIFVENDGVVYAFSDAITTEAFYTSTTLDTGATGQAFPTVDPTAYPFGVSFFIDIRNGYSPEEVRSRFAVQINGGSWYSSKTILNVPTTPFGLFANYELHFDPAASGWDNLTVTGTGSDTTAAVIGGTAASDLVGNITGAGLVVTYGPPYAPSFNLGGTHDFDDFQIVPSAQPGDVDLDTDVDLVDLLLIRTNFREAVAGRTFGDLTNDGFVDFDDYRIWKDNYPVPLSDGTSSVVVPEPGGFLLLAMAFGFIGRACR
jgi:hypothetical protein